MKYSVNSFSVFFALLIYTVKKRREYEKESGKKVKKPSFPLTRGGETYYNKFMAYIDREKQILEILKETPTIGIQALRQQLYASESTIRRDLKRLEEKGLILRPHGKITSAATFADKTVGLNLRENFQNPIKRRLAENAVTALVYDGSVIVLDASSTVMCSVSFLSKYNDIIVITSGLKTSLLLSQTAIKFYTTGGRAINTSYSYIGQTAIDTLKTFNADICFVSCHGLSEQGFATDTSERENDVRKAMMQQAKRKALLIDSSKINKGYWHNLCHISEFDDVFCDTPLPENLAKSVKNFHLV